MKNNIILTMLLSMLLVAGLQNVAIATNEQQEMRDLENNDLDQYIIDKEQGQEEMSEECPPPCMKVPDGSCVLEGPDGAYVGCGTFPGNPDE